MAHLLKKRVVDMTTDELVDVEKLVAQEKQRRISDLSNIPSKVMEKLQNQCRKFADLIQGFDGDDVLMKVKIPVEVSVMISFDKYSYDKRDDVLSASYYNGLLSESKPDMAGVVSQHGRVKAAIKKLNIEFHEFVEEVSKTAQKYNVDLFSLWHKIDPGYLFSFVY